MTDEQMMEAEERRTQLDQWYQSALESEDPWAKRYLLAMVWLRAAEASLAEKTKDLVAYGDHVAGCVCDHCDEAEAELRWKGRPVGKAE